MNSSSDIPASAGIFSSDKIGALGYGLGVSIGFLLLLTTIILMSYFCTRRTETSTRRRRWGRSTDEEDDDDMDVGGDLEAGLDEATLKSYPKLAYSRAKKLRGGVSSSATCCSICLADYKDSDVLRLLPECGHVFHLKCVDPWLRVRPTCPVCRSSPLPTPLSTPLAEVVPLSAAGRHA